MTTIVIVLWRSWGEYVLLAGFFGSIAAMLMSLRSNSPLARRVRLVCCATLCCILLFLASLGPATYVCTHYKTDFWTSRELVQTYQLIYNPIGRLLAFRSGLAREAYCSYVSLWLPPETTVRDMGWGIELRGAGYKNSWNIALGI